MCFADAVIASWSLSQEVAGLSPFDDKYFYRPQRSWGQVIFSEACVKNSVHRGVGCLGPGPGEVRGSGWGGVQAHTQGGVSQHALRQTATAAGGTHPTGMHSCLSLNSAKTLRKNFSV